MKPLGAEYVERRTGFRKRDPIYAHGFLDWAYNSAFGWWLTSAFFSRRVVSRLYGWWNKRRWSRRRIAGFVESMGVDMSESVRSEAEFTSFNDFICREIDLSRRPVDRDPAVCVAPADGRVLAFGCVGEQDTFAIKRHQFGLGELVGDAALARRYAGGAMLISRLYLADYHHFHFPASGIAGSPRRVEGKYLAVSPYARRRIVPWLTENTRVLTELASDAFGRILMIEVGAFTVGSIQQRFPPATRVGKGDPKGFFELGGSVVVLLFERGRIRLDPDLCDFTRVGVETFVRLGESIGRAPARGRSRALEFSGKIG